MSIRLFLVVLLSTIGTVCQAEELRAGAARIDITPPIGHALWGYAARHDAPSTGVLDHLHARALVLEVGKKRIALVSLDLGRAPVRDSTAKITQRVRKAAGIDTVFLVGSHTHNGPTLEIDTWPTPKSSYVRQLEENLGNLILSAVRELRPARLGIASKQTSLNRNRHSKRPERPVDGELLLLRLEDAAGTPIAHAFNFAAHPTLISAKSRDLSADYPGVTCAAIEKQSGAPCLFLQGAAGDLSPNTTGGRTTPEKFGFALAEEIQSLIGKISCVRLEKTTLKTTEDDFRFASRVDLGNPVMTLAMATAFYPALVAFYEREYRDGVRPRLTTALLDGRIGFVGVSGEFFCEHALHLKKRARLEHLFFLGYCNDYHQYFPTIQAASEGGYGSEPYIGIAAIGSGERMMDRALLRLYQLRGKLIGEESK